MKKISVRLLSPEPAVVKQPQVTRVEEPTLLCNHVANSARLFLGKLDFCGLYSGVLQVC